MLEIEENPELFSPGKALTHFMMGTAFLGFKDVKMAIYHCITGYKLFGKLLDPRGHPDPYDSFRMVPSPLVPRLIAPYPRLYHGLLYTLSILFAQQGLYTDSIEIAHEGVQTSQHDQSTQDRFRELMEMGLKSENERVGREELNQERAHKQPGVSWGGVYRDHGIFQNAQKSRETKLLLGKNRILRVDSVRQEVSLLNHDLLKEVHHKKKVLQEIRMKNEKSGKKKEGPPRMLRGARSMDLSNQAYQEAVKDGLFDKSFQETGHKGVNSSIMAVMAEKKSGRFDPTDPSVIPKLQLGSKAPLSKSSRPPSEFRLPSLNYKLQGALSTDREPFKPSWSKKADEPTKKPNNPRTEKVARNKTPESKQPVPHSPISTPTRVESQSKPRAAPLAKPRTKQPSPTPIKPVKKPIAKPQKHPSPPLQRSKEDAQLEADNIDHEKNEHSEPAPKPHLNSSSKAKELQPPTKQENSGSFTLKELPRDFKQSSSTAKAANSKSRDSASPKQPSRAALSNKTNSKPTKSSNKPKDPEPNQKQKDVIVPGPAEEIQFDIDSSRAELPEKLRDSAAFDLSRSVHKGSRDEEVSLDKEHTKQRAQIDIDDEEYDDENTAPEFYITKIEVYY